MKKILFLIHDLSVGGAEKVLVNLVNNMNPDKFDITVMALFDGGVNRQFLKPHIKYRACFKKAIPGNSHLLKFLSPAQLHRWLIKDEYDVEVSYLEGPSARIISGCKNKKTSIISWIHIEQHTKKNASRAFRSFDESMKCYEKFDLTVCVSEYVKKDFNNIYHLNKPIIVLYNTNETQTIIEKSREDIDLNFNDENIFKLVGVGKVVKNKGFDRLARIHKRLHDAGLNIHTYILGVGDQQKEIEQYLRNNNLSNTFTFLGYQTNPYKYVAKCDLFVCCSFAEGFSTAATEALIVGTPVCTVDVSGMKEMLGELNEYGIVTENNEDALYHEIKKLVESQDLLYHYKKKAIERGKDFSTEKTVKAVENMLLGL